MPTFRYACPVVVNIDDPSITEPSIIAEFPNLSWNVEDTSADLDIPFNRTVIKVINASANQDRMIAALPYVSKYVPPSA